jgi:hypothetical protein
MSPAFEVTIQISLHTFCFTGNLPVCAQSKLSLMGQIIQFHGLHSVNFVRIHLLRNVYFVRTRLQTVEKLQYGYP